MDNGSYFGDSKRIKEYRVLFYIGITMLIICAFFLITFNYYLLIAAIVLFSIGLMCAMAGFLGLREEFKKYGMKRIETKYGKLSLFAGVSSLFAIHVLYISFILAIVAILCGIKARMEGDNTYGKDGMICGIVTIGLLIYIVILFRL